MFQMIILLATPTARREGRGFRFLCLWGCWCRTSWQSMMMHHMEENVQCNVCGFQTGFFHCSMIGSEPDPRIIVQWDVSYTAPNSLIVERFHTTTVLKWLPLNTPSHTHSTIILTTSDCLLHDRHLAGLACAPPGENRSFSRPDATSHTFTSPSSPDTARWLPSGENTHSSLAASVSHIAARYPRGFCACVEVASTPAPPLFANTTYSTCTQICTQDKSRFKMCHFWHVISVCDNTVLYRTPDRPRPSSSSDLQMGRKRGRGYRWELSNWSHLPHAVKSKLQVSKLTIQLKIFLKEIFMDSA